jgi:hypothetical protein
MIMVGTTSGFYKMGNHKENGFLGKKTAMATYDNGQKSENVF